MTLGLSSARHCIAENSDKSMTEGGLADPESGTSAARIGTKSRLEVGLLVEVFHQHI